MKDVVHARKATAGRNPTVLGFALLTLWLGSHGAADAAQTPATETATDTFEDGLQQVPVKGSGTFWVRPNVDLRAYDRVALKPIRIEYKGAPRHYRIDPVSRGVLLTERDREQLQQSFYDAFKGWRVGRGSAPHRSRIRACFGFRLRCSTWSCAITTRPPEMSFTWSGITAK
jgi:hypothetical protein